MGPPVLTGNDQYLYVAGLFDEGEPGGVFQAYKRNSNGSVELELANIPMPPAKNSADQFQPFPVLASDSTDHLAAALQAANSITGADDGPVVMASFTSKSNGNLVTTNTPEKMAVTDLGVIYSMSISPTGKLLAVGGGGGAARRDRRDSRSSTSMEPVPSPTTPDYCRAATTSNNLGGTNTIICTSWAVDTCSSIR